MLIRMPDVLMHILWRVNLQLSESAGQILLTAAGLTASNID